MRRYCGSAVLPVSLKAKCGRRLRPKGAKRHAVWRAFSFSFCLRFVSFSDDNAVAVIDFMLDDLRGPAGEGLQPYLELSRSDTAP